MTEKELDEFIYIKERIKVLDDEIHALFEAQDLKINPLKRVINVISRTKDKDYPHECSIKLSFTDIRLLQDVRIRELSTLKEIVKEK